MVLFTQDALAVVKVVHAELDRRLSACNDLFMNTTLRLMLRQKSLCSNGRHKLSLVPTSESSLSSHSMRHAAMKSKRIRCEPRRGAVQYLIAPTDPNLPADDFPVDTWLYGVARVREKMRAWEQTVMFAGGLGRPEPALDAMQFPFITGDRWLALEFPPDQKLDQERLLYTAHFASDFDKTKNQCGMLLDEWAEIIPTSRSIRVSLFITTGPIARRRKRCCW